MTGPKGVGEIGYGEATETRRKIGEPVRGVSGWGEGRLAGWCQGMLEAW